MYTKLVFIVITLISVSGLDDKEAQIKELEKQKSELFKQINEAIEDSVQHLNKSNDNDTKIAINHMQMLKIQINEVNGTEDKKTLEKEIKKKIKIIRQDRLDNKTANSSELRRSFYGQLLSSRNEKLKLDLQELAQLLKKRDQVKKKDDSNPNKFNIEQKLQEWIIERQKKRQQRRRRKKWEKCPAFGVAAEKRKEKTRRQGRKRNKQEKYPCCRKCCKKSYMGCL